MNTQCDFDLKGKVRQKRRTNLQWYSAEFVSYSICQLLRINREICMKALPLFVVYDVLMSFSFSNIRLLPSLPAFVPTQFLGYSKPAERGRLQGDCNFKHKRRDVLLKIRNIFLFVIFGHWKSEMASFLWSSVNEALLIPAL